MLSKKQRLELMFGSSLPMSFYTFENGMEATKQNLLNNIKSFTSRLNDSEYNKFIAELDIAKRNMLDLLKAKLQPSNPLFAAEIV